MARYSPSLPTDFEAPTFLSVGGLLVDTMMKVRAFIACAAIAATMVAASAMSGTDLAHSDLDQLTRAQAESVDRPIEVSLPQIQKCLDREDSKNGQTALHDTFAERDDKCPIKQMGI